MKYRPNGFTLIELLVVIAIISILAAILFPVFAAAREKARITTCVSNEKQIGIAMLQYTSDYDEFLPPASIDDPTGATTSPSTWMYEIDPYVKSGMPVSTAGEGGRELSVFVCPDYLKTSVPGGNSPTHSYCANANLMPSYIAATGQTPALNPVQSVSKIRAAAQTVLFAEAAAGSRIFTTGDDTAVPSVAGSGNVFLQCQAVYLRGRARHNSGGNYLFSDGHVKWIKAPGESYLPAGANWWNVTPIPAQSGIVYSQASYPGATGWFLEQ
ncbi:MAG TPA: DUF1559 domain-containing protein [Capsulimonadaceae bacterium]|jgi:prepilin-type N-terminal cleavage/methylation domain-containing protein/prepilin-type processing-associated H-X9-DG protein